MPDVGMITRSDGYLVLHQQGNTIMLTLACMKALVARADNTYAEHARLEAAKLDDELEALGEE